MYLFIYSNPNDPVIQSMQEHSRQDPEKYKFLSVNQILNDTAIFDTVKGIPTLEWTLGNSKITNSPETLLVNRVFGISSTLFSDFHPDDQDYAQKEFYAYLSFALEAFPNKMGRPGPYGLAGNQFPLSLQWETIRKAGLSCLVPEYYYGSKAHCPFDLTAGDWIMGRPYSYYDWKPSHPNTQQGEGYLFCYRRPLGNPIAALVSGSNVSVRTPDGNPVPESTQAHLSTLSRKISALLELPLAELLFFEFESQVSFAMASPLLQGVKRFPDFAQVISAGIRETAEAL